MLICRGKKSVKWWTRCAWCAWHGQRVPECNGRRQEGAKSTTCLTHSLKDCILFGASELLASRQEAVNWTAEKAVPAGLTASRKAVVCSVCVSTPVLAIRFPLERTCLTLCDDLHIRSLLQPKAEVFQLAGSRPGCRNPRLAQRTPVPAELDLCRDALRKCCFHSDKPSVSACILCSSLGELCCRRRKSKTASLSIWHQGVVYSRSVQLWPGQEP